MYICPQCNFGGKWSHWQQRKATCPNCQESLYNNPNRDKPPRLLADYFEFIGPIIVGITFINFILIGIGLGIEIVHTDAFSILIILNILSIMTYFNSKYVLDIKQEYLYEIKTRITIEKWTNFVSDLRRHPIRIIEVITMISCTLGRGIEYYMNPTNTEFLETRIYGSNALSGDIIWCSNLALGKFLFFFDKIMWIAVLWYAMAFIFSLCFVILLPTLFENYFEKAINNRISAVSLNQSLFLHWRNQYIKILRFFMLFSLIYLGKGIEIWINYHLAGYSIILILSSIIILFLLGYLNIKLKQRFKVIHKIPWSLSSLKVRFIWDVDKAQLIYSNNYSGADKVWQLLPSVLNQSSVIDSIYNTIGKLKSNIPFQTVSTRINFSDTFIALFPRTRYIFGLITNEPIEAAHLREINHRLQCFDLNWLNLPIQKQSIDDFFMKIVSNCFAENFEIVSDGKQY